jgi:hypothetical protein
MGRPFCVAAGIRCCRQLKGMVTGAWRCDTPHTCVVLAQSLYRVGAVSGKVARIGSAKTATTAIMAPGTMIQPVRSVRTWAT